MASDDKKAGGTAGGPLKTDGSLGDAKFEKLKRPVNADGFLVDRPLSPEEEGLAGPLPDDPKERKK